MRHVAKWLPSAEQVTIPSCGHVPQVERPQETHELLTDFFARAERIGAGAGSRSESEAEAA
jgi:pimeloyl-ACP methyl ester carboxylesterase